MIITFGEIMMRLSPSGYLRFVQADELDMTFGGAEANVSVSLAGFGKKVRFVTGLPDNDFGSACANHLRRFGVDISEIITKNGRLGIYFCEKGASQRPSKVIYDRAESVVSKLQPSDFDWESIFNGAKWFHFTGITPALSDNIAQATLEACIEAKKQGLIISCDLNYREKMWTREKAHEVMSRIMPYVDILISNEQQAKEVFGISTEKSNVAKGGINIDESHSVVKQLKKQFDLKLVAVTFRESISASVNNWSAMLYDGEKQYISKKYNIQIVDRVGGGDSFAAGLIYALTENYDLQNALEFAVAASCLKHSIEGDFNLVSVDEVKSLADGDASGILKR